MSDILLRAYSHLNNTTPLSFDCGRLCEHRCCRGSDYGMALLPGERELLSDEPGYNFLENNGKTLLVCSGRCRRHRRPFACRIFPLFPLVTALDESRYRVRVIPDPRGRSICPLALDIYPLRGIFRYLVRKTTRELLDDPEMRDWFLEESAFVEALHDVKLALLKE